jgi:Carboxypeptidase regulatory-like domain
MAAPRFLRTLVPFSLVCVLSTTAIAQQTGNLVGRVGATDGSMLPGVTVEAKSAQLPQARTTVTDSSGEYRLPALVPGNYTLTFSLAGMQTLNRQATVLLGQDTAVDVKLGLEGVAETITVTAEGTLVERQSAELGSALSNEQIQALPVSQEYKDLQKLIPGVQISQDVTRGPSAGGSGQDNVYLFDGVNVTMPLFGVLVAEPATHDIAQFSVLKGGAKADNFERAGGFSVDSVSKSGTNKFSGTLSYQLLSHNFIADQTGTQLSKFQQDRNWTTVNLGGPVWRDRLFFYGSYYHPKFSRDLQSNLYGELPDYELDRTEYFGKLTFTPMSSLLLNGSYRSSHREETGDTFTSTQAGTIGFGYETEFKLGTLEGSWVVNPKSYATFKVTDFRNPGAGVPAHLAGFDADLRVGAQLDINNLDKMGLLTVPTAIASNPTQSAFVAPFITKYGYVSSAGVRTGGGQTGFARLSADDDSFYRKNYQIGFNYTLGGSITHDLHAGFQRYIDEEDRFQSSNGWGSITIPGGSVNCPANRCGTVTPAFFQAVVSQQSGGRVPAIHSEIHSQNFEINDTIRMNNWTFNVGVLASTDTLYGQGLKEADNVAGFVGSPGTKYKMHETPWGDMIQPRLSVNWAYNGSDTLFASYARYNPAANSDARAASWDRNLVRDLNVYFDRDGKVIGIDPVLSSSGKLFVDDIEPRKTNEFMIGTGQQLRSNWSARFYGRHKKSYGFWEDTNNNARILFGKNVPGVKQELYIEDLSAKLAAIGSGSTYVITELDGAFTKYYEATLESDWHASNMFLRGSYTWSHYYGNFDQDNSSFNTANDAAIFIGSSNIADGAGRQLWDNKYGDLRGDRRHVAKVYGTYNLPWRATTGFFAVYQSGQPYQLESFLPYGPLGQNLTTSTSDTNRYAEPAGRRRSPSHHQVDLNYTQNWPIYRGFNLQFLVDVFNLYDNQTGYNYETRVGTLGSCDVATTNCAFVTGIAPAGPLSGLVRAPFAKSFYDPRRYQLALRLQF